MKKEFVDMILRQIGVIFLNGMINTKSGKTSAAVKKPGTVQVRFLNSTLSIKKLDINSKLTRTLAITTVAVSLLVIRFQH